MDPLYLRKLRIDRQVQNQLKNLQKEVNSSATSDVPKSTGTTSEKMNNQANELVKNIRDEVMTPKRPRKYNYIASIERSDYVKKMMNLPRTLPELLIQLQKPELVKPFENVINQQVPRPDGFKEPVKNEQQNQNPNNSNNQNNKGEENLKRPVSEGFKEALSNEVNKQNVIQANKPMPQPIQPQVQQQSSVQQQPLPPEIKPEKPQVQVDKPQLPPPVQVDRPLVPQQPALPQVQPSQPLPLPPQQVPIHQQPMQPPVQQQPLPPEIKPEKPQVQVDKPQLPPPVQVDRPLVPQQPAPPQVQPSQPMPLPPQQVPIQQQPMQPPVQQQPLPPEIKPEKPQVQVDKPQLPPPVQVDRPLVPQQPVPPQVQPSQPLPIPPQQPQVQQQPSPPVHNVGVRPDVPPLPRPENIRPDAPRPFEPQPFIPQQNALQSQIIQGHIAQNIQLDHQHRPLPPRPEPPHHRPSEHNPSSEVGKVVDRTIEANSAQAALYSQLSMNDVNNPTLTQMRQRLTDDAFELLFTGMLNLNDLSNALKNSGKDARAKLILAMANASKQGVDNSQISSSLKLITESMAIDENNPASILKNIIALYLPWYPLQEGVGFNLKIDTMQNSADFSSILKVFIQTRNYGNVNGSLILMNQNNVDMNIQCDEGFPKDDLLERMKDVTVNHTMHSNITVEQQVQYAREVENSEAKVNLSATYDLNPFLLLLAHSFIKNTIIIDGSAQV